MKNIGTNIQFGQQVRIPDGGVEGTVIGINLDEHGEVVFTVDCETDGIYDPMYEHEVEVLAKLVGDAEAAAYVATVRRVRDLESGHEMLLSNKADGSSG